MLQTANYGSSSGLMPVHKALPTQSFMAAGGQEEFISRLIHHFTLRMQPEWRSTNVLFWGRRNKGKSLSMVWFAKLLEPWLRMAGWKIKSNINVGFADLCDPNLGTWLGEDLDRALRSLLLFDELTEIVPSTRAMAKSALDSHSLMVMLRKLQAEVIASTQFPTEIQRSMLRQIDLYILCDAHIPKFARFSPALAQQAYIRLLVFDLWGQFTGIVEAGKTPFPPPIESAIKVIYLRNLPAVWNEYNTRERVVSSFSNEYSRQRILGRTWDLEAVSKRQDAEEEALMTPAEREFQEEQDARVKGFIEQGIPSESFDLRGGEPQSLEEWLKIKRAGTPEGFRVNLATLLAVQKFVPDIKKVSEVVTLLEANNFYVTDHKKKGFKAVPIQ